MLPRLLLVCLLVTSAHAQNTADASRGLDATIASLAREGATWFSWRVPFEGRMYCETLEWTEGVVSEPLVLARVEAGELIEVKFVDPVCWRDRMPAGIRHLSNVATEDSLAWLHARLASARRPEKVIATIALHAHPTVIPSLMSMARHDHRRDVRKSAIFWLGQKAGVKAAGELKRSVDDDPDDEVKKHAVFAIAQLPDERSVPMLIELVKTHRRPAVRKRAMFWLAQKDDPRALELIAAILEK